MKSKKSVIVGWVLSVVVALLLSVLSAYGKFFDFPNKDEMFANLGWDTGVMVYVGIAEVAIALMFLVPRLAFVSAILMSAYLGGATAAHVRIHENFLMPVLIGIIAWIALGLRDPRIFQIAFSSKGLEPKNI
ncbi:hypothetical protein VN12_21500 [Pirellula sp. SH-Sr6A]|uniref:DoxX family protein n=1 Tax=Pirellula sp. SH-Sr6A TaxID=1632865 RepID=UPI00078D0F43|nr:DoxX family protein [Pirellula sp. SH-Sr6A]AMV34716.1 hypothetical protein VN12_21500 [Pirellula sp. SH-Sr6A]